MTRAIAEFNMGRLRHDWTDPRVRDFVDNLERVNRLAERSKGFIWRMPEAEMEAGQLGPPLNDHRAAATMSIWQSAEDLWQFIHKTVHGTFLRRGPEWFEPGNGPRYVLWPVDSAHRPSVQEGFDKLQQLAQFGPSEDCFDFKWVEKNRESA